MRSESTESAAPLLQKAWTPGMKETTWWREQRLKAERERVIRELSQFNFQQAVEKNHLKEEIRELKRRLEHYEH
jgi:hypothetical protein